MMYSFFLSVPVSRAATLWETDFRTLFLSAREAVTPNGTGLKPRRFAWFITLSGTPASWNSLLADSWVSRRSVVDRRMLLPGVCRSSLGLDQPLRTTVQP